MSNLNPYKLDGPLSVSLSGGRTSAYMLRQIIEAGLPGEHRILFANTGKEREETLQFVQEIGERWGVGVVWLEWQPAAPWFNVVNFETASRNGEPFAALIEHKKYLPNPTERLCTHFLKVVAMRSYLKSQGWTEWTTAVGVRYDEPNRWKIRGNDPKAKGCRVERELPLVEARVVEADILDFWKAQPFDLQLAARQSNCDLCFLKGMGTRGRVMMTEPERAQWWIDQEESRGARFRSKQPSYKALLGMVSQRIRLPMIDDEPEVLPVAAEARAQSGRPLIRAPKKKPTDPGHEQFGLFDMLSDDQDMLPCMCTD